MQIVVLVGAGGMVGAVMRYLVGRGVFVATGATWFPYGTLAVNVTGCFLIGFLAGFAEARQTLSPETRAFLLVGILGGFTTFSAFGLETVSLVRQGEVAAGLGNIALQLILGLAAVWVGLTIAQRV
jgi:CrcB protein